jgi:hypothetical protein
VAHAVGSVALLWRGPAGAAPTDTREYDRLRPVCQALAEADVAVELVVYSDDRREEALDRFGLVDGILVWVDPIGPDADRTVLDAVLREASSRGAWVSAHPDTIEKMGTKEVLYRTRSVGWGVETRLYASALEFREQFPASLALGGARVVKQNRGNGGIGVWKVALVDVESRMSMPAMDAIVRVQHAAPRDEVTEDMALGEFVVRCDRYFAGAGKLIDQPFLPHLDRGMVRAYLVQDQVVGFALQHPAPAAGNVLGLPSAKTMYDADHGDLAGLRRRLEDEWLSGLCAVVGLGSAELPFLWDADFLHGSRTADGVDTYVLCEINVSSVLPFPPRAPAALAAAVRRRLDHPA